MTRVAAALLAAFVGVAACQPKFCMATEAHCEGNVVVAACSAGDDPARQDCGSQHCTEGFDADGSPFALCTLDGRRDARCPDELQSAFCDGDRAVSCEQNFPVDARDCAALSLHCATDGDTSVCVESTDPDPHCPDASGFCDDGVLESCFGELREPRTDCKKNGSFCHEAGEQASCVLDEAPDPRCTGAPHFCDGTRGFKCFDGFRQSLEGDCASQGKTCVDDATFYGCR